MALNQPLGCMNAELWGPRDDERLPFALLPRADVFHGIQMILGPHPPGTLWGLADPG